MTVAELWRPEVARLGKNCDFLRFFSEKRPLRGNFQNFVPEVFIATLIETCCVLNFVKCDRREVGEIVRYFPDKQKKFRLALQLSSSRYCVDRAQNLSGPAPDNVFRMLQISSKLVRFWRSYTRTRVNYQNGP